MPKKKSILFVIALCVSFIHCTAQQLVFTPHWIPQAQFAGYYVALDRGFYEQEGLDVKIAHPSASISVFEYLTSGQADIISTFLMDAIKERASGIALVNISQISQHSALMMVAKKSRGIHSPKDLDNKKLGIWSSGFRDVPYAFMREQNLNIQLVPVLNTINLFLMDGVEALTVMYYNEYDQIINSGIDEEELTAIFFADYGLDIPEDGLYTLEHKYNTRREDLIKFVKATFRGWEYAQKNKEYAIDLVVNEMKKAHLPNNRTHQRWMLDKYLQMIEPGSKASRKGELLPEDFQKASEIFRAGFKGNPNVTTVDYTGFYKPILER